MSDAAKAIVIFFFQMTAVNARKEYGAEWTVVDMHEFFIYNGTALETYEGARRKCDGMKSHLPIVDTDEMHILLVKLIERSNPEAVGPPYISFYIGLHDYTGGNTNFIWDNGDILHFIMGSPMQWADGEPNDFNGVPENCVTMGSSAAKEEYKWFDVPCSSKRSYICQRFTEIAVPVISVEWYIISSCVIIFIVSVIAATAIYHRRRILHVRLVAEPPLSPYNNVTVERELRNNQDDEVIKTSQSWINKRPLRKNNAVRTV